MANHSSILAWKIPWTEEQGWLQSMGLQRVGHDWGTDTLYLYLDSHVSDIIWYLSFSRSIHVSAYSIIASFLWLNNISLYEYTIFSLSIHKVMDILCYFLDWANHFTSQVFWHRDNSKPPHRAVTKILEDNQVFCRL